MELMKNGMQIQLALKSQQKTDSDKLRAGLQSVPVILSNQVGKRQPSCNSHHGRPLSFLLFFDGDCWRMSDAQRMHAFTSHKSVCLQTFLMNLLCSTQVPLLFFHDFSSAQRCHDVRITGLIVHEVQHAIFILIVLHRVERCIFGYFFYCCRPKVGLKELG